jgi:uncharacterized protein
MKEEYSKTNLHIIDSDMNSILYNALTNTVLKIPSEFGKRIKSYQNGEYDIELEKILDTQFENKLANINKHTNWYETKILDMLVINVTNNCNLRCKYCYANYGKFDNKEEKLRNISNDTIDSIFQYLIMHHVEEVHHVMFFGGEPLLGIDEVDYICSKFNDLYKDNKLNGIPSFSFVTNLTIMNQHIKEILDKYNISITVSIDGPSYIHDQQRVDINNQGSFNRIIKNYSMVKKHVIAIESTYTLNHILNGMSVSELRKWLSMEFDISETRIDVVPVSGCKELEVDAVKYNTELTDNLANMEDGFIFAAFDKNRQSDLFCNAGSNRICISIDGDIYPCQMYVNYPLAKLGNVKNDTNYQRQLDNIPYRNRNRDNCSKCWARKFCKVCPAQALINDIFTNEKCNKRLMKYEHLLQQCVSPSK